MPNRVKGQKVGESDVFFPTPYIGLPIGVVERGSCGVKDDKRKGLTNGDASLEISWNVLDFSRSTYSRTGLL